MNREPNIDGFFARLFQVRPGPQFESGSRLGLSTLRQRQQLVSRGQVRSRAQELVVRAAKGHLPSRTSDSQPSRPRTK